MDVMIKNKVIEIAKNETVYSFGDKWLYKMSHEALAEPNENKIASMVWLIGRSYAASPERITKAIDDEEYKKNKDKMPEIVFENMSRYLVDIIKNNSFEDRGYTFDSCDIDLLSKTIDLVFLINQSKDFINRATNMISFSSKFLHFCMPQSVFIIDQYSRKGTSKIFGSNNDIGQLLIGKRDIMLDNTKINEYHCKYKEVKDELIKKYKNESQKDYVRHVCGCYSLASLIHDYDIKGIQVDENKYSIPRLVDSVLMCIGKTSER